MFNLNKHIRTNILGLKPYSSARTEYNGNDSILLDANENPFGKYNRYPDPLQQELKRKVSEIKKIDIENIFIGNGSDEIIDLTYRIFCNPGKDKAITFSPSYGMYEVLAEINNIELLKVPLNDAFQIDFEKLKPLLDDKNVKLLIICSPNNPTGNIINNIDWILTYFKGIVLIDEAYIDFSNNDSYNQKVEQYPNIIVMQTLSKAWGLASARIRLGFANADIISVFNKVKPPYNVSMLNQKVALNTLENYSEYLNKKKEILDQKNWLISQLQNIPIIKKIYPSDANFILVETSDADKIYKELVKNKVITRNRNNQIKNCIRITVGNSFENQLLINTLKRLYQLNDKRNEIGILHIKRISHIIRRTTETSIAVEINLDGNGDSNIYTGIGFFDHLLEQIAKHGNIDLSIFAKGDLHIDTHHTIEDIGIALGEAFTQALKNKKGIERYGFLLPMDDCLAQVAIDFGGRSWLVWNVEFKREKIGEMPTEMFVHFFKSFCDYAKCNLYIKAEGENEHHKIEAVFKAFANAIKMAIKRTNNINIPSTKGIL